MKKKEILDHAIAALREETGIEIDVLEREHYGNQNSEVDAFIRIQGGATRMAVETKKWAPQMNVGAVINTMKNRYQGEVVFVGDYINTNTGEKLREANVQYMDTAGNSYIDQKPIYIHISGKKKKVEYFFDEETGRAFNPTGLKVTFLFLINPELVNAPYREIAKKAKVALGNIGWIMRDLINGGYIQEAVKGKTKKVQEYDRLLDQWIERYPVVLKPKLKLGEFVAENPGWWRGVNNAAISAYWSGELAAAEYTDYLNPKDGTVYIAKDNVKELATQGRLRKKKAGEKEGYKVQVYETFWNKNLEENREGLANPIIVYADLVATGDTRNLETAERLREKLINRHNW